MGLERKFEPEDIGAKIIEGTPIKATNFKVRINNHTVTPRSLTGHKIPILEGTSFGPVSGEIITQEISLMKDPRNPRQAFERQSKLLKDAFID